MVPRASRACAVTRWLLSCGIHSQGKHALAGYFVDVWSSLQVSLPPHHHHHRPPPPPPPAPTAAATTARLVTVFLLKFYKNPSTGSTTKEKENKVCTLSPGSFFSFLSVFSLFVVELFHKSSRRLREEGTVCAHRSSVPQL